MVSKQREYVSLATETGQVHVAIQTCKSTAGRMQIEVLLFPAEEESYFNEIALDSI